MFLFSIPDSGKIRILNFALFEALQNYKEWFYDDFKIDIVYGCPPSCIWNGGRVENGEKYSERWGNDIVKFYMRHGAKYRLNFTNLLIQENHLKDEYANSIAKVVNEIGGFATVTLQILASYIEKMYPNLPIVWSTSSDYGNDIDEKIKRINFLSKKNIVVLPYELNDNILSDVFLYPENLEILVGETCLPNCPKRKEHQIQTSKTICEGIFDESVNNCLWKIEERNNVNYSAVIARQNLLQYTKKGVNRFKISGRDFLEQALAAYVHYFVVEQYRDNFISFLIETDYNMKINFGIINVTANPSCFFNEKRYERMLYIYDKGGNVFVK